MQKSDFQLGYFHLHLSGAWGDWRRESAYSVDQLNYKPPILMPEMLLSESFLDIFVVQTKICGCVDSRIRRICKELNNCPHRGMINVPVSE